MTLGAMKSSHTPKRFIRRMLEKLGFPLTDTEKAVIAANNMMETYGVPLAEGTMLFRDDIWWRYDGLKWRVAGLTDFGKPYEPSPKWQGRPNYRKKGKKHGRT